MYIQKHNLTLQPLPLHIFTVPPVPPYHRECVDDEGQSEGKEDDDKDQEEELKGGQLAGGGRRAFNGAC